MSFSPFFFIINKLNPSTFASEDDKFFACALEQAHFCTGNTHPNPSVGAVIVKDNQVVSIGHTEPPPFMHAETQAIVKANRDLYGATLYVTLEPCCHFGRTPPCTKAIIESGIKRVVFGTLDPNPRVFGEGVKTLRKAGLEVDHVHNPLLKKMAFLQVLPFEYWIKEQRPFVIAKIATSKDYKIASKAGVRTKITGQEGDLVVHQLRRACDSVLIGANTARIDDPKLTARFGTHHHNKQPMRVVLSSDLALDARLQIFDTSMGKTTIITANESCTAQEETFKKLGISIIKSELYDKRIHLKSALNKLASVGITSVLMEPGAALFEQAIKEHVLDEIWWLRSQSTLGTQGVKVPFLEELHGYRASFKKHLDNDELIILEKQ